MRYQCQSERKSGQTVRALLIVNQVFDLLALSVLVSFPDVGQSNPHLCDLNEDVRDTGSFGRGFIAFLLCLRLECNCSLACRPKALMKSLLITCKCHFFFKCGYVVLLSNVQHESLANEGCLRVLH